MSAAEALEDGDVEEAEEAERGVNYGLPTMPGAGLDTDWMREGSCLGEPPDLWNPDHPDPWKKKAPHGMLDALLWGLVEGKAQMDEAVAKRVCVTCPVKAACREFADRAGIKDGVWGGANGRERQNVKHREKKRKWRAAQAAKGLPAR